MYHRNVSRYCCVLIKITGLFGKELGPLALAFIPLQIFDFKIGITDCAMLQHRWYKSASFDTILSQFRLPSVLTASKIRLPSSVHCVPQVVTL